jgi:hypothetical protein
VAQSISCAKSPRFEKVAGFTMPSNIENLKLMECSVRRYSSYGISLGIGAIQPIQSQSGVLVCFIVSPIVRVRKPRIKRVSEPS